jgi:hypothetical protein
LKSIKLDLDEELALRVALNSRIQTLVELAANNNNNDLFIKDIEYLTSIKKKLNSKNSFL